MRISALLVAAAVVFSAAAARADIEIATVGPVTGQLAALGEQMLAGAKRAVADVNARGGVLGQKLALTIGDDQCDPKQAVAVANRLAAKGVVFVAGHFCSGASIPASKVYEEEGVVMISPASTSPQLTDAGGATTFRVCGRDDQQGDVLGKFLAGRFAGKRVAIVHDKSAYGKGLADATRGAMRGAGLAEALYETYTAGEKDYTALVSKLKSARIDALFLGGYHTEAGLILRQMRDQGHAAELVGGDALVTDGFWAVTGAVGEGALFSFAPDARLSPSAGELVARFRADGQEPAGYVLYTYAAIEAWVQAAERAGTVDPVSVARSLKSSIFDTAIGRFRFTAKGDADLPPYAMYVWKGGKFEPLRPPP